MIFFVISGPNPLKGLKTERRFKLAEKFVQIDHISYFFHSRAFYQIPLIFWWHYMEKASIYVDYVCPREKSSLPMESMGGEITKLCNFVLKIGVYPPQLPSHSKFIVFLGEAKHITLQS